MFIILDKNGIIESSKNKDEIQFIWDLSTKELHQLVEIYGHKYQRSTLKIKQKDIGISSWTGDLLFLQQIDIHK